MSGRGGRRSYVALALQASIQAPLLGIVRQEKPPRAPLLLPPTGTPWVLGAGLGDEARAEHFVKLWTLKEAYVKALGKGISAPPGLRGFSFTLAAPGAAVSAADGAAIRFASAAGGDPSCWQFALLQPTAEHVAALCVAQKSSDAPLQLAAFSADALLEEQQPVAPGLIALGSSSST